MHIMQFINAYFLLHFYRHFSLAFCVFAGSTTVNTDNFFILNQLPNVTGALKLTRTADERSRRAEERALTTENILDESRRNRKRTDIKLLHNTYSYQNTRQTNDDMLDELALRLDDMKSVMPELNLKVIIIIGS